MTQHAAPPAAGSRPLDASLFSFYGFGSRQAIARRRLRRARLRGGEPAFDVIDGAILAPRADLGQAGRDDEHPAPTGGVASRGGQPAAAKLTLPSGILSGSDIGACRAVTPVHEVDEQIVYLGSLSDSYGHFLLESLARAWVLTEVDPSVRVAFHRPNSARWLPKEWMLRMLAAFGVPRERILLVDSPTRFRRVIVPEPLFDLQQAAHERAVAPYRAVAERVAAATEPSGQPVYFSRRLLPSPQRQIIGEAELEDVLRENGFLVVHPETMTFEDQVRLVNGHTDIFTSAGSTAHNVLFALHQPRLHLLTHDVHFSPNFFLCSALVGAPTAFVNGLGLGDRTPLDGPTSWQRRTPEIVAVDKLAVYLDERGLLRSRVRATLAGRNPELRRAYDEAWLYARIRAAWPGPGAALPDAVAREAVGFAQASWPVSLALARYYARWDPALLDRMAVQFADLAATEFDINRLARYRADVEDSLAAIVTRCEPATANRLAQVMLDRFLADRAGSRHNSRTSPSKTTERARSSGIRRRDGAPSGSLPVEQGPTSNHHQESVF